MVKFMKRLLKINFGGYFYEILLYASIASIDAIKNIWFESVHYSSIKNWLIITA